MRRDSAASPLSIHVSAALIGAAGTRISQSVSECADASRRNALTAAIAGNNVANRYVSLTTFSPAPSTIDRIRPVV
jgi:hypothetical protein